MRAAASSSSSRPAEVLTRIPLHRLDAHPLNANVMAREQLDALERHLRETGRYPPLIVRPNPGALGHYELLDGHQRKEVLERLGHESALCLIWDVDDEQALLLLATLNRLHGEDLPVKRAELLAELNALLATEELALLLPEDADQIRQSLDLLDLDSDRLLRELEQAAQARAEGSPRLISFAVAVEDEPVILEAIELVAAGLGGRNKRGRALAQIARAYLGGGAHA